MSHSPRRVPAPHYSPTPQHAPHDYCQGDHYPHYPTHSFHHALTIANLRAKNYSTGTNKRSSPLKPLGLFPSHIPLVPATHNCGTYHLSGSGSNSGIPFPIKFLPPLANFKYTLVYNSQYALMICAFLFGSGCPKKRSFCGKPSTGADLFNPTNTICPSTTTNPHNSEGILLGLTKASFPFCSSIFLIQSATPPTFASISAFDAATKPILSKKNPPAFTIAGFLSEKIPFAALPFPCKILNVLFPSFAYSGIHPTRSLPVIGSVCLLFSKNFINPSISFIPMLAIHARFS